MKSFICWILQQYSLVNIFGVSEGKIASIFKVEESAKKEDKFTSSR
jgi:hypothetical protein